jgi:hypothetical protein
VALRLHIDTWRWAGVPFYIRAGKNLPITTTEVIVDMKTPPLSVFDEISQKESNYFRFRLSPEVIIAEGARVKKPGEKCSGEPVELVARHHPRPEKSPYERLLGDAIRGDNALFTSDESVEAAWAVVDQVLTHEKPVATYKPGSWGPAEALKIVEGAEGWHDPDPRKPPMLSGAARQRLPLFFLLDVDNTLLDNDRFAVELGRASGAGVRRHRARPLLVDLKKLRDEFGYADYLGTHAALRAAASTTIPRCCRCRPFCSNIRSPNGCIRTRWTSRTLRTLGPASDPVRRRRGVSATQGPARRPVGCLPRQRADLRAQAA